MDDDGIDVIGLVLGMRADGCGFAPGACRRHGRGGEDGAQAADGRLLHVEQPDPALARLCARSTACRSSRIWSAACEAVRHLVDYAAFRRRVAEARPHACRRAAPIELPRRFRRTGRLTEAESKKILAAAGLPVTREAACPQTPAEAVRIAAEIGGPVALKIQSPDIPHKSDVGGVHLGARTAGRGRERRRGRCSKTRGAIARTPRSMAFWCRRWSRTASSSSSA